MDCEKSQFHPQNRAYMRMEGKKSPVGPQKRAYMRMEAMKFDCCHRKEPGASANKKAPGSF